VCALPLDGSPAGVLKAARKAARRLDAARPTAVALHNALGWVLAGTQGAATVPAMRKGAREAAKLVALEMKASRASIAVHGSTKAFLTLLLVFLMAYIGLMVGADTVARDGCLFNKIGTAGVAALAGLHEVPFYAAAGLHKFSRMDSDDVPIEERPASEVVDPRSVPRGTRVFNPVFDRTPPERISAFITEQGLASPRKAVQRNLPALPPEEVWG